MPILDQYGAPIDRGILREPQTARIAHLQQTWLTPMLDGLTPAKLAAHLRAADDGDLTSQHRLFADMEERDPHLMSEIGKRKMAILNLDWDIKPPRNATPAEEALAEWVDEVLRDAIDPLDDLLLSMMDALGHGFSAAEIEWRQQGGEWLPCWHPRPQEWFRLSQDRRRLTVRDNSADGADLLPFGWVFHTHGKAKTGYLGRLGLYRALVWPFLYKAYALGDFAEFLETYGLPMIVGKYHAGATSDERASLMRAVSALGHDARAIMPADMAMEIQKVTGSGDGTPHMTMIDWADKSQSKAILGATLTSGADGASSTNALGKIHNEVRKDLLESDARQLAATLTRDLIYPLIALNKGAPDGLRRCPRMVFDCGEAEDLALFADALPKLVSIGMRIPAEYAHDKLRIPEPEGDEPVLSVAHPSVPPFEKGGTGGISRPPQAAKPGRSPGEIDGTDDPSPPAALKSALNVVALAAARPQDPTPATALAKAAAAIADPAVAAWVEQLRAMLDSAASLDEFRALLDAAFADLPDDQVVEAMGSAMVVASLAGRFMVREGR